MIYGVMKVLLINGSPRDNGNTFTALSEVAKTLNEEGVRLRLSTSVSQTGCQCGDSYLRRKTEEKRFL